MVAAPACRLFSQNSTSDNFRGDGGRSSPHSDASSEARSISDAATDAETWIDAGDALDGNADTGLETVWLSDAETDLTVDAEIDADAGWTVELGSEVDADGAADTSAGIETAPLVSDGGEDVALSNTEAGPGSDSGTADAPSTLSSTSSRTDTLTSPDASAPGDSASPTVTIVATATGTTTVTGTASRTPTATATSTSSHTASGTPTATGTQTSTASHTTTPSASGTSTTSQTATITPSATATATPTGTASHTATTTPTATATGTGTSTPTSTISHTATATPTATATSTPSSTASVTSTQTTTSTPTGTASHTATQTSTSTPSATSTGSATGTGTLIPVTGVTLNKINDPLSAGNTDQLIAMVSPNNATNRGVIWSTSNAAVATISSTGLVTAVSGGTASIIVTTLDGAKQATCVVTVVVQLTGIRLSLSTATIGLGQSAPLTATLVPANATNQTLNWSSSDPTVATVSATGAAAVVSTISGGNTTITVTAQDGNKTAICLVTVAMAAQWARMPSGGESYSNFSSAAVDSNGNIFVVGTISGTSVYNFGNSVTAFGSSASNNLVLVKYDPSGTAEWARSTTAGPGGSSFNAVATDAAGNVFAVGAISGSGTFGFGNSVTGAGSCGSGNNVVLVKYDASGAAQWARSVDTANAASSYAAVAIDSSGNLYAAGTISGSIYEFGNDVRASGLTPSGKTALLVKYDSTGIPLWAQGALSGSGETAFSAVTASATNSVYAAGYMTGLSPYGFSNATSATGTAGTNALLVQYNPSGMARWARTSTGGSNATSFGAVAAAASGTVYAAGWLNGYSASQFGTGVTITGADPNDANAILLKYDASGAAQWGLTPASATGSSRFAALALDQAGNIYAAGSLSGPGPYDFGNSMVAQTSSNQNEILLAQFSPAGLCHSAETAMTGASTSGFYTVTVDSAAHVYTSGAISGTSSINFGNTATVTPASASGSNAVLVRYQ